MKCASDLILLLEMHINKLLDDMKHFTTTVNSSLKQQQINGKKTVLLPTLPEVTRHNIAIKGALTKNLVPTFAQHFFVLCKLASTILFLNINN